MGSVARGGAGVGAAVTIGALLQRGGWGRTATGTSAVRLHSNPSSLSPTFGRTATRSVHSDARNSIPMAAIAAAPRHSCWLRFSPFRWASDSGRTAAAGGISAAPVPIAKTSAAAAAAVVGMDSASAHAPAAAAAALPSAPPPSPTLADIYGAEDVPLVLEHLSQWWSVLQLQDLIGWLHTTTAMPWWASIAAATFCLRVLVIPLEVLQLRNSLRMKRILPDVERIQSHMNAATTEAEKRVHAETLLQLFKDKKYETSMTDALWASSVSESARPSNRSRSSVIVILVLIVGVLKI